MHARDPAHWLYRFDAAEWLAAAATELQFATQQFRDHNLRAGVTHCRRGAGMALNAVLIVEERPGWGRSYMEHVVALASLSANVAGHDVPDEVITAARRLRETPTQPPPLVQLSRRGQADPAGAEILTAAQQIVAWATDRVGRPTIS